MTHAVPPADGVVTGAARAVRACGGPELSLWAACSGGTESEVAAELAAFGWQPLEVPTAPDVPQGRDHGLVWERGSVYGRANLATVLATLRCARTPARVVQLLSAAEADTLEDVESVVADLDWSELPFVPFAVRPERRGDHPFRSPDIGRVAGSAVVVGHRAARGRRLPIDLDDPDVEVRVDLAHRRLRVGLDLVGASLHRRTHHAVRHRAGLRATVAASLLVLSGWRDGEVLVDPMCGAATIPVEAGLAALRRPPGAEAGLARMEVLGLAPATLAADVDDAITRAQRHALPSGTAITGVDRSADSVGDAHRNTAAAGLWGVVRVDKDDARRLATVDGFDVAVVNPPFGIRMGQPRAVEPLYARTLAALCERLRPGGRIVWLSPAAAISARAASSAGLEVVTQRTIGLGGFDAVALVLMAR